jgi:uncharacterized cupredoxin-like copper-binding protein
VKLSPVRALSIAAIAVFAAACTTPGASSSPAPASPAASDAASPAASDVASPSASTTAEVVTVTAVEYAFQGAPATAAAGTQFGMKNGGKELHELVLVRKNDGVTESWDALLQLPEDQALSKVTMVGQVMAEPGKDAEGTVTADKAGEYLMICFVPVGMTALPSGEPDPSAEPPAGEPHFVKGMLHELTVN